MFRNLPARLVLGSALILASVSGAVAHEAAKGPNGGAVADVSGHHVEFVPSATELTFYLTGEADAPIASIGAKVKAIAQDAGKTAQIDLAPVEPNKLVGKLTTPLTKGAKVVVTGVLSDGHSLQAKFGMP
jgi:methionine-rich copper-binding protein CopC